MRQLGGSGVQKQKSLPVSKDSKPCGGKLESKQKKHKQEAGQKPRPPKKQSPPQATSVHRANSRPRKKRGRTQSLISVDTAQEPQPRSGNELQPKGQAGQRFRSRPPKSRRQSPKGSLPRQGAAGGAAKAKVAVRVRVPRADQVSGTRASEK